MFHKYLSLAKKYVQYDILGGFTVFTFRFCSQNLSNSTYSIKDVILMTQQLLRGVQ